MRFDENNACTALNLIYFFSLPYFPEKSKHFLGNAQKTAPNKGGYTQPPVDGHTIRRRL